MILEVSSMMIVELGTIVVIAPEFIIAGLVVAFVGRACGQIYMDVGMVVKRELSRAQAPVIAK